MKFQKIRSPLQIKKVEQGSIGHRVGLRANDRITAIDDYPVCHELDFLYLTSKEQFSLSIERRNHTFTASLTRAGGESLGIMLYNQPIRLCGNKCLFCFIDQLPQGMRKSLYVKDEDLRHSFLYGNYVTLTNATNDDLDDLARLELSPIYVSVHSTSIEIRNRLLGKKKTPDLLAQLRKLKSLGIGFHAQIVVCPGINDGKELEKTIRDLLCFKKALLSIAVVPVGLTRFRDALPLLKPVCQIKAQEVCTMVESLRTRLKRVGADKKLFLADEIFLRARHPIPAKSYYHDYPQIENGVGLIRDLCEEWKKVKKIISGKHQVISGKKQRIALITSVSAGPFLSQICCDLTHIFPWLLVDVVCVANHFFGESVSVAGLLTAGDVVAAMRKRGDYYDRTILPDVMFNISGHTLDGQSIAQITKRIGVPCTAVSHVKGLVCMLIPRFAKVLHDE